MQFISLLWLFDRKYCVDGESIIKMVREMMKVEVVRNFWNITESPNK